MLGGIHIEGEVWLGDDRASGGTLVLTTEGAQAPGVVVMMQRVTADRQFFGIDQQPMQFMVSPDGRVHGRRSRRGPLLCVVHPTGLRLGADHQAPRCSQGRNVSVRYPVR